jgi:hypothetical protein
MDVSRLTTETESMSRHTHKDPNAARVNKPHFDTHRDCVGKRQYTPVIASRVYAGRQGTRERATGETGLLLPAAW